MWHSCCFLCVCMSSPVFQGTVWVSLNGLAGIFRPISTTPHLKRQFTFVVPYYYCTQLLCVLIYRFSVDDSAEKCRTKVILTEMPFTLATLPVPVVCVCVAEHLSVPLFILNAREAKIYPLSYGSRFHIEKLCPRS